MNARHVMILASAGSGKTYALTHRFVALLASGARPERIVALTFTRKAAGEFFDEILNKLGRAARDELFATQLARDVGQPQLRTDDFRRMLRAVVDAMPRLRLGTLDGFFARIARAFPLELGLTGEFEVLEEHAARMERRRVLQRMFARAPDGLDAAQREFIEAFKRATFGTEEKRLTARLDGFLDEHQEKFLAASSAVLWGEAARIWPDGCEWLAPDPRKLGEAVAALRTALTRRVLPGKQHARWEAFFAALPEWMPGAPLPRAIEYVLEKALAVWDDLRRGGASIVIERRKIPLTPEECAELAVIIKYLVGAELTRRLETTRGIHAVLRGYETVYHDAVRRSGRLTFSDVQRLLQPEVSGEILTQETRDGGRETGDRGQETGDGARVTEDGGQQMWDWGRETGDGVGSAGVSPASEKQRAGGPRSQACPPSPVTADGRLLIDFRLDGQFDHWLLDEFQDTSFGQWSVLRNLIDEAVQDPAGERSFFCVGDVKQAIYTWREGDPRLFREIFDHYNRAAPGTIVEQHLVRSWRSGPAIIEMVNAVFGRGEVLAGLYPGAATETWNREWRDHESARPQLASHAAWLYADDEEERFALTVRLLHEIAPLERGLDCAILTQTNAMATAIADYLRREGGIPAIAESDRHIATDNPLGAALLALAQVAAHPGDTLAREHVHMTPLRDVLEGAGIPTPEALTTRLLAQIHAEGFERAMEYWLRRLEEKIAPEDAFSRERGRQFVAAAALFDATGSRDAAEFVAFMERHSARGAEVAGVVRVMTIHKSKGLGFDLVVLPDLEGKRIDQRRTGLAVQRTADRSVEWVLDLPPKLFYARDETLRAHVRGAEAEACYEALSLLYVAMTRAKRGMYVITKPVGTSESRNYSKLLTSTLGAEARPLRIGELSCRGAWVSGNPSWHQTLIAPARAPERGAKEEDDAPLEIAKGARATRRPARRPSAEKAGIVSAAQLFVLEAADAAEFGTAVHALLAEVEWVDTANVAAWEDRGLPAAAVAEAMTCLRSPLLGGMWLRLEGAEVWRERAFEVVLDGAWVTGVFDRVVIERDARGRVQWVTVFDFKTDRIVDDAEVKDGVRRHAAQLNLYRRVAAAFAGVPVEVVTCELVFTRLQRRVRVPAE